MNNNCICMVGALSLGLGHWVNQTLRILVVSASLMGEAPAQTSAWSWVSPQDVQVSRGLEDLASSVKVVLPGHCIKTAARRVEHRTELLAVFRPSPPAMVNSDSELCKH
uniref:Uncharacterized protein n=1 Tax=Equus asinus TaxID=9793 RepID=A0A9L0JRQ0_EQUAS